MKFTWTKWPLVTGQQFIHHSGETWVGQVQQVVTHRPNGETVVKLVVWKGGGHFVLWSDDYQGTFRFRQIKWPKPPE